MSPTPKRSVERTVRVVAFVAIFPLLLSCAACEPVAGNSSNTTSNAPANSACAGGDKPAPKPEEAKEAKYPHQVIAALAKVYLQYNIIDEALRLYELAINTQYKQTGSEDAENWTGLGDALAKAKRTQEAAKAYQRALQIYLKLLEQNKDANRHNFYVERIALLYKVLGSEADYAKYVGMLKADENSAEQQVALARILESQQNFEKAEACYKRAMELTKNDLKQLSIVRVNYANMLNLAKRSDEALAIAKEIAGNKDVPEDTRKAAKRLLFSIYEARGELDKLEFK